VFYTAKQYIDCKWTCVREIFLLELESWKYYKSSELNDTLTSGAGSIHCEIRHMPGHVSLTAEQLQRRHGDADSVYNHYEVLNSWRVVNRRW
jgi:hypothetical protein